MVKLSIIIPIYKAERYINQCIDSVLREAPEESEIILVDDGSPDRCSSICDDYKIHDKRIKVIHKENTGLSDSRNIGLDTAVGEYVFFIDSDDYIECGYFDKLLAKKADLVIGSFVAFYEDGSEFVLNLPSKSYNSLGMYLEDFHYYFPVTFNTAWGKLYRRDLIECQHIRFQKDIFMVEDLLFNLEYYSLCTSFIYQKEATLRYRQTAGTLSRKINRNVFKWYEKSYTQLIELLTQNGHFCGENKELLFRNAYGNIVECLRSTARISNEQLDILIKQVCNSNFAIEAAKYNPSKKTFLISKAIHKQSSTTLKIAVKSYVLVLWIKAFWRKIWLKH